MTHNGFAFAKCWEFIAAFRSVPKPNWKAEVEDNTKAKLKYVPPEPSQQCCCCRSSNVPPCILQKQCCMRWFSKTLRTEKLENYTVSSWTTISVLKFLKFGFDVRRASWSSNWETVVSTFILGAEKSCEKKRWKSLALFSCLATTALQRSAFAKCVGFDACPPGADDKLETWIQILVVS